jgi:hypothetical protein
MLPANKASPKPLTAARVQPLLQMQRTPGLHRVLDQERAGGERSQAHQHLA